MSAYNVSVPFRTIAETVAGPPKKVTGISIVFGCYLNYYSKNKKGIITRSKSGPVSSIPYCNAVCDFNARSR